MIARVLLVKIYKNVLRDYKLCMCCPRFCFLYQSLICTLNAGRYTPISPLSTPNGLLLTLNVPSRFVLMITIKYVHWGGGGGEL